MRRKTIISRRIIKPPHDLHSYIYISFALREDTTDCLNKVLSTYFDDKDVSDVTEKCNIVVNMDLLTSR